MNRVVLHVGTSGPSLPLLPTTHEPRDAFERLGFRLRAAVRWNPYDGVAVVIRVVDRRSWA